MYSDIDKKKSPFGNALEPGDVGLNCYGYLMSRFGLDGVSTSQKGDKYYLAVSSKGQIYGGAQINGAENITWKESASKTDLPNIFTAKLGTSNQESNHATTIKGLWNSFPENQVFACNLVDINNFCVFGFIYANHKYGAVLYLAFNDSKEQYDSYAFLMEKKLKDITTEDLQKAVDDDTKRPSKRSTKTKAPISPKTVRNTYSYIRSVINYFYPNDNYDVRLPKIPKKVKNLIPAKTVLEIIKDTEIELPCLLACWLSYSMSEIRGIRVRDISNGYITLDRVIVDIGQTPTVKESGKAEARLRKHHIPNYIQALIDKNISGKKPDDPLITLSGHAIYMRWVSLLEQHDLPHMTFHDLRHLNASVMAMLRIPDKYAQERGGWSSDRVMKNVYTHTFSEEREKVDETIDNYFDSLLDGSASEKEKSAIEIINALREADPNGWYKALLNMQHEMQHKN